MSWFCKMQVIERALEDEGYRQLLFANPGEALAEYDLTVDEIEVLSNLNADNFDEFDEGLLQNA